MSYTIGEMAKRLGVAPSTLRYYDSEGLLPFVERSEGGIRIFKDDDYVWLHTIQCLKKTGMSLRDIKRFVEMAMQGDETIEPRLALITQQKEAVEAHIRELSEILLTLEYKEWYYQTALEYGSTDVPRNMPPSALPPHLRRAPALLRGETDTDDSKE